MSEAVDIDAQVAKLFEALGETEGAAVMLRLIDALTARCKLLQVAQRDAAADTDRLRRKLGEYGRLLDASTVALDLVVSANAEFTGDTHCKILLGQIAALRAAPLPVTKETIT